MLGTTLPRLEAGSNVSLPRLGEVGIDATIKSLADGTTLPGHMPALVTALMPAVKATQGEPGDKLANAIKRNVVMNVEKLTSASDILGKAVGDKSLRVVGGIYRLATGRVELLR